MPSSSLEENICTIFVSSQTCPFELGVHLLKNMKTICIFFPTADRKNIKVSTGRANKPLPLGKSNTVLSPMIWKDAASFLILPFPRGLSHIILVFILKNGFCATIQKENPSTRAPNIAVPRDKSLLGSYSLNRLHHNSECWGYDIKSKIANTDLPLKQRLCELETEFHARGSCSCGYAQVVANASNSLGLLCLHIFHPCSDAVHRAAGNSDAQGTTALLILLFMDCNL